MCEVEYKQGRISIPDKVVWGLVVGFITASLSAAGSAIYSVARIEGAIEKLDKLPDAQVIEERYSNQQEFNRQLWEKLLDEKSSD